MLWSHHLAPLPVVLPLLIAALLAAIGGYLPRRLVDVVALLTSAAVLTTCCLLARASSLETIVYWFGNWRPDASAASPNHFPVGICFSIEPLGAGLAALVALLATASFAFSWAYFEEVKSLYHALMLTFVAAMCGLCLTGDLFNLFVWFELMTAAAVGLCGYKSEESRPLQGALNFAVMNTVGAFLSLGGVALLYAKTGSLNMAEVGRSLAMHTPGHTFLLVAFAFLIAGFLVKLAVVPFHFWLADAHAVAPTPVCVLFSGAMVELGLFAIARLHWLVFAPSLGLPEENAIRHVLLFMGALTAVTGAIYCFAQRHLKRMLAFSTISHVGLMMIGFALLEPGALGGVAIYVVGHGAVKGALFLGAGILLHRCGSVDEYDLRGKGKNMRPLAAILAVGAIALAGMPPFATFYGGYQIHHAAEQLGIHWLSPISIVAEALTAGAVLRFTGRVFFGWGMMRDASSRGAPHIPMDRETAAQHDKTPPWMWAPAVVLLVVSLAASAGAFRSRIESAADHFEHPESTAAAILNATPDRMPAPHSPPAVGVGVENAIVLLSSLCLAAACLFSRIFGAGLNGWIGRTIGAALRPLRKLQSGHIGDYVAWFAFGMAAFGGVLLICAGEGAYLYTLDEF